MTDLANSDSKARHYLATVQLVFPVEPGQYPSDTMSAILGDNLRDKGIISDWAYIPPKYQIPVPFILSEAQAKDFEAYGTLDFGGVPDEFQNVRAALGCLITPETQTKEEYLREWLETTFPELTEEDKHLDLRGVEETLITLWRTHGGRTRQEIEAEETSQP